MININKLIINGYNFVIFDNKLYLTFQYYQDLLKQNFNIIVFLLTYIRKIVNLYNYKNTKNLGL